MATIRQPAHLTDSMESTGLLDDDVISELAEQSESPMATITLTIPDAKVPQALAAIRHTGFEQLEGETAKAYAARWFIQQLIERDYVRRKDTAGVDIVPDDGLIGETP